MASLPIGEADDAILQAVNRLQYMTAAQVGRLLYPQAHDENRYVQRRLRRLAEADYLLRLRELPTPRIGSAPHVFTLADQGRKYLSSRGVPLTSAYYRPSEERRKAQDNPFMEHTLAAVDVLVAAGILCRDYLVTMPRLVIERELKRSPVRVRPLGRPDAPRMAVIPDAWFELVIQDESVYVALELDRATEGQQHWRRKVAALAAWAEGPYREAFRADNLTIAVVVPNRARLLQLYAWTEQELQAIDRVELGDIFLFTDAAPVTEPPYDFFFDRLWCSIAHNIPQTLLDVPAGWQTEDTASPASAAPSPPARPDLLDVDLQLRGGVEREIE
ncbi:replication-relaxation family protein [Streptomyces sp. NPDC047082]|uniref:replication-relaxation family protein n=1 Tax=Streptomyces sp. NPDC047082 TaxID=3155259 RepID=UPI0033CB169F